MKHRKRIVTRTAAELAQVGRPSPSARTVETVFLRFTESARGDACPLNDGAAAVVVMSDTKARELGVTPLARIISSGVSGLDPEIMGPLLGAFAGPETIPDELVDPSLIDRIRAA